jgi:hypothetical protein
LIDLLGSRAVRELEQLRPGPGSRLYLFSVARRVDGRGRDQFTLLEPTLRS